MLNEWINEWIFIWEKTQEQFNVNIKAQNDTKVRWNLTLACALQIISYLFHTCWANKSNHVSQGPSD